VRKRVVPLTLLLPCLCIGACAVGPDFVRPDATAPAGFATEDAALAAADPEIEWWSTLNDPLLNRLIVDAVAANHDLRVAQSNVRLARALVGEGRFDRYPTVTVAGAVNREKLSEAVSGPGAAVPVTFRDGGFDASWELDFFGRIRRNVEALAADYDTALADQRNAFVIVTAEVARNYVELRGAQHRLQVAELNAVNQEHTFQLTQALLSGGRGTKLDIARAQSQLEATRASIPPLDAAVAQSVHRLSVLLGQPPGALYAELATIQPLLVSPRSIRIGDPAALLRRRPDVAAAEFELAAATARIGVATADLFPNVTVIGSAGYSALDEAQFGSASSERFSIGPFLRWAGFDFGRVRARIGAAGAFADARLANYERTVLLALEETENALINFTRARQREERLRIAADAGATAADLARLRYRNGADSFLVVLDAERRVLELQDQLASGETDSARNLIAVYKALGGAWQSQLQ
jgi:multidrug efflux system outer membrane protein